MADIEITVDGGTSKRLLTAGKYCDRNILVTATGGGGGEPEPPDDGKTRLYITVPANSMPGLPPPRNEVPLYIQQSVANGVTIDWGDGSDPETLPGTGNVNTTHTYQTAGDFVISLDPAEGCTLGLGHGRSSYCMMGSTSNNGRVYCNMLQRAVIGSRGISSIRNYAFRECYSLSSVTIPDSVTSIGSNVFSNCYSLSSVTISDNVASIETYTFSNCYSLASVTIPDNVTYIRTSVFDSCCSLSSVTISDNVTSIGRTAFSNCYSVKEYHLLPDIPPSLSSTSAFNGIPSDCIIYVPVGSLQSYQTATNWSNYADQMQEEPA